MFALNQRNMCAASVEHTTTENRTVSNTQAEQFASGASAEVEVDNGRKVAFARVLQVLHKTFQFVTGAVPTDNSKKRKITEDDSRYSIAKKRKTDLEECVSKSDTGSDNDCSICLAPWSATGDHRLTSLKCGHLFGRSCVVKWIENAHNCPYCCTAAEITDLRNIFAQIIQVEDTTDRDLAIEQLRKERAAKKELKRKLIRQKENNKNLRLELNQLKGTPAGRTRYFPAGFGIVAALVAVKDSFLKRLSTARRWRYRGLHHTFIPSWLLYYRD